MLPRLQAEEDLRIVAAVAAGTGSMREQDRRSYMRQLSRQAGAVQAGPLTVGHLRAMGVRVREVPAGA